MYGLLELDWFSDKAGLIGLALSVIGFIITGRASLQAKRAAEDMRSKLLHFDSVVGIQTIIEKLDHIKQLHRKGAWDYLPDHYSRLLRLLFDVRSGQPNLTPEQNTVLQRAVVTTRRLEEVSVNSHLEPHSPDAKKVNRQITAQMVDLSELLSQLKTELSSK